MSRRPQIPNMGIDRFPIWALYNETQGNELAAYINGEKQYPIRAIFGMGMNYRMFPHPSKIRKAIEDKLEFFALSEIFLTDTAKLADIVLPACTSYERGEFRCYPGGLAYYSTPVVDRVGESKSDLEILSDLALLVDHDDDLLRKGHEAWVDYIIQDTGYTVAELKKHDLPVRVKNYRPYQFGDYTRMAIAHPPENLNCTPPIWMHMRSSTAMTASRPTSRPSRRKRQRSIVPLLWWPGCGCQTHSIPACMMCLRSVPCARSLWRS